MKPENLLVRPRPTQKCTTGCPVLDRCLGGGIPCRSVTEIVAESGCGKTQLCLQLLLSAQLPPSHGGLSASSLYLHSEFPFPSRRLHQLSRARPFDPRHDHDPLEYIFVHPLHSADHLLDAMPKMESFVENFKSQFPIRLIVIDSIAALFRSEFDNNPLDLKRRSSMFFKISGKLKLLAEKFDLAVVVTNQVVDLVAPNEGINGLRIGNLGCLDSSGRRVCAALGLAWANCVNSRLFLSRDKEIVSTVNGARDECGCELMHCRTRRKLHLLFAPHIPDTSCEFVITREGISGVCI
ncbi:DNA repair protein XRCC3 homolog [Rhodamnia argentea]|uniref:DNA repair protein XRCC3 homolog n=1 Tax=Rhodamnia argentea TaxID=178133 RepID=A0ABM3H8N6_9MYRT|nr:DNA repair protein XRCC3 homolog [Rhodamnia argentea]XP_048132972.1 DNA repair protein XRCC3 homolog [Rhodamnia argentea]